jgi:hypothetical protein
VGVVAVVPCNIKLKTSICKGATVLCYFITTMSSAKRLHHNDRSQEKEQHVRLCACKDNSAPVFLSETDACSVDPAVTL